MQSYTTATVLLRAQRQDLIVQWLTLTEWSPARPTCAANYFSGELTVLRTSSDGALLPGLTTALPGPKDTLYPGPVDIRQEGPHAHCFYPDPGSNHAFAADLGSDEVVVVSVDAQTGRVTVTDRMKTPPGTGPRHCALSPDRTHLYVVRRYNQPLYVPHAVLPDMRGMHVRFSEGDCVFHGSVAS